MLHKYEYTCQCGEKCVSIQKMNGISHGKPYVRKVSKNRLPTLCAACRFAASKARVEEPHPKAKPASGP